MTLRTYHILPVLLLLAACGGDDVKETLGLDHDAPDEFTVVSRPPLTVPKEFYLVPPTQGDASNFGEDTSHVARQQLTGKAPDANDMTLEEAQRGLADTAAPVVQSSSLGTPGESSLLRNAGAEHADPDIRNKLYSDTPPDAEKPGILEKLRGNPNEEPVVNAKEESERLRANKDAGKPLNQGEVKTEDPKSKSVLDRVFE
ncbi:MAG: DUF3035 domain-containing protein [Rickettsiales bacterium]